MPPRVVVAVVVLAWLTANGALLYREALPYWQAAGPPPYNIDLTEELSNSLVNWEILQKDKRIGSAVSRVERQRDRTFWLWSELRLTDFPLPFIELKKITTAYHVSEDGSLLGLAAEFVLKMPGGPKLAGDLKLGLEGEVSKGEFTPRLTVNEQPFPLGEGKVALADAGEVINPMQLLNRVPGLTEGRQWRMTLFDPVSGLGKAFPQYQQLFAAAERMTIPELRAVVVADTLPWADEPVACFKIEYRKPGDPDPVAATWVRRRDGLVLQQYSGSSLLALTIRRIPTR